VLALFLKETKWASELAKARQTYISPAASADGDV
jgi:hypothetical protein